MDSSFAISRFGITNVGVQPVTTSPPPSVAPVSNGPGFETPAGLALHSWIDKPDTKYHEDGLFKTKLVCELSNEQVKTFKAKIDAAAMAVLEEETKGLSAGQKKKWEPYLPYTLELDDKTGAETGRIIFDFKRNAKVTIRKTGESKVLSVAVYDPHNRLVPITPPIPTDTLIRIVGNFRPVTIAATSRAGVRMDFFAVQHLEPLLQPLGPFRNSD